jgi:hypothetical protein
MSCVPIGLWDVSWGCSVEVRLGPVLWSVRSGCGSCPGPPFLALASARDQRGPIRDGNFQAMEVVEGATTACSLGAGELVEGGALLLRGDLRGEQGRIVASFNLTLSPNALSEHMLHFEITVASALGETINDDDLYNRLYLRYEVDSDDSFHGFGEQFADFNLRKQNIVRLPILVSEQGVGRGLQPLTSILNKQHGEGVGGHWFTTYAPKPMYISAKGRALFFENSEVFLFLINWYC